MALDEAWMAAARHRAEVADVPFVAITGSCGKSTAKELIAGVLAGSYSGSTSPGSANCGDPLVAHVLKVAPSDDFCLQELGAWGPGTLDAGLELIRPSIGVVLNVRRDHFSAFRGLAGTQAEKAKVVASLPASGTAILNADDPLVWDMRFRSSARILSFGRAPHSEVRAAAVSARWPDRLSFELSYGGASLPVQTRLVGEQALGSALAAIAVGVTMGVPVEAAVRRLERVEPPARRMSAVSLPDGVTFIRDDFKAPSDSMPEVLSFMAAARATRKVAVIGRVSDYPGRSRPTYTELARAAADLVDELVFVGERAHDLWGAGATLREVCSPGRARVSLYRTVEAASAALKRELRTGDLVLLKASGPADHLERILHDRIGDVRCWLTSCGRVVACEECDLLSRGGPERAPSVTGGR
jgi:UDP-N-acetylmuramyl pentapeptide synthase